MLNPKMEVHPMIWNHFEADRAALGTQYTEEHWDAGSGLSPEALIIAHERAYSSLNPAPLFSATLADCVARGVDAYSGGAKYNNSAINAICIASTVDALAAVRRLVYEEKKLKLSEFAAVLRDNWKGHAELRQTALHRMPKYGNGDPAVDALAAQVMRDTAACINGKPNGRGGVTLSGGEPLLQADFCRELLTALHAAGVNTAVDTCLAVPEENLQKVIGVADTFLVDVKAYDSELHRRLCGLPNERILSNLRLLDSLQQRVEIRIPFVPGQNAGEIEKIADFLAPLTCVVGVRVLKYHNLSGTKYESLDMTYPLAAVSTPVPTAAETEAARAALEARGIRVLR